MSRKEDHPSITCPRCGWTSYNPGDIEHRYCGNCNVFHDQLELFDRNVPEET